jgi:hypothetical protein
MPKPRPITVKRIEITLPIEDYCSLQIEAKIAIDVTIVAALAILLVAPIVPNKEPTGLFGYYSVQSLKSPTCWILSWGFTYYQGQMYSGCNWGFGVRSPSTAT